MIFVRSLVLFFVSSVLTQGFAATSLPKNLDEADRIRALQILGFGSAPKVLSNPYPLGGYTGVEVGLSSEFIPVEDLASLGNQTSDNGEINYYTLSFGKGLYYNVDTYVYFTPFLQEEKIQSYGAQLRWGFYESNTFPLSLSSIVYAGGGNFSNLLNVTTVGLDILATVTMDNVALYLGIGRSRASGQFIGGSDGVTDNQETATHDITESHGVFGMNIDINKMFLAMELDRYTDSCYSAKWGYRF